ncbi:MAG TPA: hypothetical protein VMT10_03015 [Solirubrobacteraceae bacterium]|nr:hypothetical protein [Solirubrobacteraceae bacterium]
MQTLTTHLAAQRERELRSAPAPRWIPAAEPARAAEAGRVVLRRAQAQDGAAIAQLAALDTAPRPRGELLIVELDERIVAAVPVDGGPAVADPFEPTAGLVDLARRRAALLRGETPRRRRRPRALGLASGRRAAA